MIEVVRHDKHLDFSKPDYVFEKLDEFQSVLPYLLPKLEGTWHIMVIRPGLEFIRTCLTTSVIPSYLQVLLTVEKELLEKLYLEFPQMEKKEKTRWERYLDLVAQFPSTMDPRAMREIYRRVGPDTEALRGALDTLIQYPHISMQQVNRHFAPVYRVYGGQVVQQFLLKQHSKAWKSLAVLESELGTPFAFYTIRKYIRKLFQEKQRYLRNEDTSDFLVSRIDGYSIIILYWWFETATNPNQLHAIFDLFERGQLPCSLSVKNDLYLPQ